MTVELGSLCTRPYNKSTRRWPWCKLTMSKQKQDCLVTVFLLYAGVHDDKKYRESGDRDLVLSTVHELRRRWCLRQQRR